MTVTIYNNPFELHLLGNDAKENFVRRTGCTDLTSFESFWLQKTGDALRPKSSDFFWNGNSYCWWVREFDENGNPVTDHEFSVWLDKNGNCLYEDHDDDKLYRVMF